MTPTSPDLVAVPAPPGKRLAALFIDIVGAALFVFIASTLSHGNIAVTASTVAEYAALVAIMIAVTGRSAGAFLTRCALVRAGSSQLSPSLGRSASYVLLTALTAIIPPVPFAAIALGGERGSWMATLCSLQCVTFAPEDTYDEAVAAPSPYGKAPAPASSGYTNFSAITALPSPPRSPTGTNRPSIATPQAFPESTVPAWPAPASSAASVPVDVTPSASRPAPTRPVTPTPTPTAAPTPTSASYAALLLDTGQTIPVNRTIVLGRAPSPLSEADSPITVDDQTRSLSRTHVRIKPSAGGITIEDLDSANGTRTRTPNGQTHTLSPGQPIELPINSQLLLGERLISVVDLRQRR